MRILKGFQMGHRGFRTKESYQKQSIAMKGKQNALGKNWKLSEETKKKMRKPKTLRSLMHRINLGLSLKGREPYNKGKHIKSNNALNEWRIQGGNVWNKGMKYSKEQCEKMREIAINNPNRKFKDTSIELKIEEELKKRNINYQKQVSLCKVARVDFYIPFDNVVIQCDGDYWHNLEDHKKRDHIQNEVLTENGYKVFRFWEHEIKKSAQECINRVY